MDQDQEFNGLDDHDDLERIGFESDEHKLLQPQKEYLESQQSDARVPFWRTPAVLAITVHICLMCMLFVIVSSVKRNYANSDYSIRNHLPESPAREAVVLEKVVLDHGIAVDNRFKGEPRPEQDKAWESLLLYQNLAISRDALDVPGAVSLNDGTDRVLFSLDVFHNLHCLNYIRQFMFRDDYYKKSFPESERDSQYDHAGHCVDVIRQSLICEGDISISTYDWKMDHLLPWPNFRVAHECVNWNHLMSWASRHAAPDLHGSILTHPKHGPSFPVV
ncbi:hypothetical protein MKX07_005041 [Trichoderma sp. CBMAI-0711]|nr:hypothetical protein MKX07_005041 [Trichoderma sp. CBMAI-0711]